MILDATNEVTRPEGNAPLNPALLIGHAVHHTVGSNAVQDEAGERATIRAIDAQHVTLGFGGFGYHNIVFPSGRAYHCGEGQRAHVAKRNHELRGTVLSGTFTDVQPGEAQLQGLREVLLREMATKPVEIRGHREWALPGQGTACPGVVVPRDWQAFLQDAAHFTRLNIMGDIGVLTWSDGREWHLIFRDQEWAGSSTGRLTYAAQIAPP